MELLTIDNISVLLVESSTAQKMIMEKAIRGIGVTQVEQVKTGTQALTEAKNYPPDLIISSFYLPDMTGADLLESLRRSPLTAAIPFVLISTETKFDTLDPVRQAGAIAILSKPFTHEQMSQALYATLDILEPSQLPLSDLNIETLKVLLVDDSILAREHVTRLLDALGITDITEATDGQQAIDIIENNTFDLVISDYNMPNIDGKELAVHIRQCSHLAKVPILMITSEENRDRLAALHASGVSAICNKPFDLKTFKGLIEQIAG